MKTKALFTAALLLAAMTVAPAAWGDTITKTYRFSGSMSGVTCQGYFYEEGKTGAHYICYPSEWTSGTTSSIHATLADGITINIASSNSEIFVHNGLAVAGNVTVTVGGGTQHNYYIWHVELYNSANQAAINEYNWGADVESTHTFSKTINPGYFYKLVVTYSADDIYLISDSSTIISGVEDEYAYTGSRITPVPTEVTCNGRVLTKGTHYTLNYSSNTAVGEGRVIVNAISPYHGYALKDFTIYDPTSVPLEWAAGSTVEVTEDYITPNPISVTGTGNVTLRIADGVTLTAQRGITIPDGATLTMEGPGSLTVSNSDGEIGTQGDPDGGNGSTGSTGISGSFIVKDGTVKVTGGAGGMGGVGRYGTYGTVVGYGTGGVGGNGGIGISGSLIVKGGTVNINGGTGGNGGASQGGTSGNGGNGGIGISGSLSVNGGTVLVCGGFRGNRGEAERHKGSNGTDGVGVSGLVTCTADGYVIQESGNKNTWTELSSGSTSTMRYVRVIELTHLAIAHQAAFAGHTRYWATFYHPYSNYQLPAGAQAFMMDSGHTLYRVGDGSVIPSDCAVIIMTEASALTGVSGGSGTLTLTATDATAPSVSGNILQGKGAATPVSSLGLQAGQKVYVLGQSGGTVGFFQFTGTTLPAGKAYYVQ